MITMQNIQPATSLWSYPAALLKQGVIGVAAGLVNYYSVYLPHPICTSSTSELSDYLCLRSAKFFDSQNLARFFLPLQQLNRWIAGMVEPLVPDFIQLQAHNCEKLVSLRGTWEIFTKVVGNAQYWPIRYICCTINNSNTIASAFAEELIFRFGIQKIALLSLAKFFPDRIGKFLAHPTSRILIASLIFAFSHLRRDEEYVLPQFIGGLIFGSLFEKYGFVAAVTAHSVNNISNALNNKNWCVSQVSGLLGY